MCGRPSSRYIVLRSIRSLSLLPLACLWATTSLSAQRVVPVHEEPRHRLIVDSDALKALDVQIQPGDTTLLHRHSTPITYVTISRSSTDSRAIDGDWSGTIARTPPPGRIGAVRAVLSYADEPLTHQVTNVGSTLFRLIAIPNMGGGSDENVSGKLPGAIVTENRWFRHAAATLEAIERTERFRAEAPTVIVLVADGRVALEREDGWVSSLERAGSVVVVPAGASYRLRNATSDAADIVVVEVR
jgi:hypothetical protein